MKLQLDLSEVRISRNLEAPRLRACYAGARLSTTRTENSLREDEVTGNYTATWVAVVGACNRMANKVQCACLAAACMAGPKSCGVERPLLRDYHVA